MIYLPDENNESLQTLRRIEERLRRIERDLKASSEDQLFFALVFPLAVLLVTLPIGNLTLFFQDFAKLTAEHAESVAGTIKYAGIVCLLGSSAVRYYGAAIGRVRRSKTARVLSLELLIMAWDAFIFTFVVSTILNFSELFGVYAISVAAFASLLVFLCMVWVEKKILGFYASRFLIFKKDVTPLVSNLFARLGLALYIVFLALSVLVIVGVLSPAHAVAYIVAGWILAFTLLFVIYFYRLRKAR